MAGRKARGKEVTQVVFINENGECQPIRIPDWMTTTDQLRQKMDELGIKGKFDLSCFARDEEMERVQQILSGLGGSNFHWREKPRDGEQISNPVAKVSVTPLYFRALVKIAFHYAVAIAESSITGHESAFQKIKEFIFTGGLSEEFYKETSDQILTLPENYRPRSWGHVLLVEPMKNALQARLQFFLGPAFDPPVHVIQLSSEKIPQVERKGHFYMYYERGAHDGYNGEVTDLTIQQRTLNRQNR